MTPENSISDPAASGGRGTDPSSAKVDAHSPSEEQAPGSSPSHPQPSSKTLPASPPGPVAAKSRESANSPPVAPAPKAAAEKVSVPPVPFQAPASLPVSMRVRPAPDTARNDSLVLFPGELEESFESALARVKMGRARSSFVTRLLRGIRGLISSDVSTTRPSADLERMVAFDGFRDQRFEEKRERDRRYGTVYSVSEAANAFLVRLELPRRMPKSSLKETWDLPNEMPDYICRLTLADNVLAIRAGLPDEARRRLSYISSSFPSDFQTRIDFPVPVDGYKHRLNNKVIEIVVFKKANARPSIRPPQGHYRM